MMIELTAGRALAPWFGSSHYTWTNVIGVVLFALSLGYWLGGRMADRTTTVWPLVRVLALGCLGMALATLFVEPVAEWLLPPPAALAPTVATGHLVRGSLAATLLLFAAPVFCFGMTGPFLTRRLVDAGLHEGAAAGRTLAVSTLGSLVGTYLPAHLLIEEVGVRATLLLATGLIALAAAWLAWAGSRAEPRKKDSALLAVAVLGLVVAGFLARGPFGAREQIHEFATIAGEPVRQRVLGVLESPYQHVRLAEIEPPLAPLSALAPHAIAFPPALGGIAPRVLSGDLRLTLDEGVLEFHSLRPPRGVLTGAYYDLYAVLPDLLPSGAPRDVIVLGGGAGTLPAILRHLHGAGVGRIESVEIDPIVAALGPAFGFLADQVQDVSIVDDARFWLRRVERSAGLVILDAYARQIAIPAHLGTQEFFALVRTRLSDRGIFALNISTKDLEGPLAQSLIKTLRTVFPRVAAVSVPNSWNAVLLATADSEQRFLPPDSLEGDRARLAATWRAGLLMELPEVGGELLRDDRAPLDRLAREG